MTLVGGGLGCGAIGSWRKVFVMFSSSNRADFLAGDGEGEIAQPAMGHRKAQYPVDQVAIQA